MTKLTKKKRISVVAALLAVLSGVLLAFGVFQFFEPSFHASGEVAVELKEELREEYAFGDLFTAPDCTFTYNGNSAQGMASLEYPDGTQTGDENVTLNQSGNYVLRYIATMDGKVYTKEYPFAVHGRLASYKSAKTSMEYGLCTEFGANSTGLTVRIANGDALAFDHVFDMTKVTMSTKLLEGFIIPSVQGTADFSRMVFTFTDVEDPSVQLVFNGNFHNDPNAYGLTFFTAAGNGQIQTGLEKAGTIHVGSTLGCMVPHSFIAMDTGLYWGAQKPMPAAPDKNTFCISYDYKANQAWAGGKFISDLDDSTYYGALWFGFPSGKAKLTISALNYNGGTANMCFTSIFGVDLSAKNFIDEEAPSITVDNKYETMPSAVVGGSYPVPSATARDFVSGECDVNVSVWHGYGTETQKMIDVQGGRFAVSQVGTYAIVYEARDFAGNVAREVLWVRASLSQYLPKLKIQIGEFPEEVELGSLQDLPEVTVSGGSGDTELTYTLAKGDETCPIVGGKFRLESAGDWVLTCTATDYIGTIAVKQAVIKGVVGDKPVLYENPVFPAGYVSGATYTLPKAYAYDYSKGAKVEKLCTVRVSRGCDTKEYKAGDTFVPTVETDGETLQLQYLCEGVILYEREVPVRVVFSKERIPGATERYRDVINVERYFYSNDGLTITNNNELAGFTGIMMTATKSARSMKACFINPQTVNAFSLDLLSVPGQSKFSQINFTLADSEDENIAVCASLIKGEEETLLTVGDAQISLPLDFEGGEASGYQIGFADNAFVVNATTSVAVSKTVKGEAFNGFPSGKLYFDIELCNVEENSALFLHKVCGVNASNNRDNTGPSLPKAESFVTMGTKDEEYVVQSIVAGDVFAPNVKATLTVITPSGEPAISVDGTILQDVDATKEYRMRLNEYGDYLFSITAQEYGWKFTNKSYLEYAVTVMDEEKPTLQFKDEFQKSLKVGGTLVIPEYTVSDNVTAAENISVMVMIVNPKGMPIYLYNDANAIRCEYAGVYKIYFYVYDELGNLTFFETSVTVK